MTPSFSQTLYGGLPLGVAATMLPHLSATTQVVVPPRQGRYSPGPFSAFILIGSPGRTCEEAFSMSINSRRSFVYLFERSFFIGTSTKSGSP